MKKKVKKILNNVLYCSFIEFLLIHIIYCISKLVLLFEGNCSYLDSAIYTALFFSIIIALLITCLYYKDRSFTFYIGEFSLLALITFIFLQFNAPVVNYFADICDSGWFSGMNYASFILYYGLARIVIFIINLFILICKFIYFNLHQETTNKK